jgi:hypothetical protein
MTPATAAPGSTAGAGQPDAVTGDAPAVPRRQPGDPHPYMLQRNPPNLWILVLVTVFSLGLTALIMALTVML